MRYSIAETFEAQRREELGVVRPAETVGGRGEAVVRLGGTRHDGERAALSRIDLAMVPVVACEEEMGQHPSAE
jgi:hypothetical protein